MNPTYETAPFAGFAESGAIDAPDDRARSDVRGREHEQPGLAWLFTSSVVLMLTWPVALALFIVWSVIVPLSLFAFVAPLLVPLAALMRRYADVHRRWASRVLGRSVRRPEARAGRPEPATLFGKVTAALRDATTWREWLWCLAQATAGFFLAFLPVLFAAATLFYLSYPLLFAVTPAGVFDNLFGLYHLSTISEAWLVTPVSLLCLGLWWATVRSCPRAGARLIFAMTGSARDDRR